MTVMPMFPLGTVLVPGAVLPLQVFEPRYRALVVDVLASTHEFGVVLIERGSEVGGGDTRFEVGCVARIVELGETPDGRYALVTVGDRRVRVERWLAEDPYPRADVAEWPDEPDDVDVHLDVEPAAVSLRRVLAMAAELGEAVAPAGAVESDADLWQLVAMAPVGPLDRLALLAAPGPAPRLTLLSSMLDETEAVLASRLGGG